MTDTVLPQVLCRRSSSVAQAAVTPVGRWTAVLKCLSVPQTELIPFDVLVADDGVELQLVQRLGGGCWRGVTRLPDVARARQARFRIGGPNFNVSREAIAEIVKVSRRTAPRAAGSIVETGIKAIDLFAPFPPNAAVVVLGMPGTGRLYALRELFYRLRSAADGPTVAFAIAAHDAPLIFYELRNDPLLVFDAAADCNVLWLATEHANNPSFDREGKIFDVALFFNVLVAWRGLYPALDPLRSWSNAFACGGVSRRHELVAAKARAIIAQAQTFVRDPDFLELAALGLEQQANARWQSLLEQLAPPLTPNEPSIARALAIEQFLTQPFFTTQRIEHRPGESVPVDVTLTEVEKLCEELPRGMLSEQE